MSLVRFVYSCLCLFGVICVGVAVSGIVLGYLPGALVFLFIFAAVALLTISFGELRQPVKAPYRSPAE